MMFQLHFSGLILLAVSTVADMVELLDDAIVGSRPFDGKPFESTGPLIAPDGAQFQRSGDTILAAHPPWKAKRVDPKSGEIKNDGTGVAFARYAVQLPATGRFHFRSDVVLAQGAVGAPRSDGVTFACTVHAADQVLRQSLHQASDHAEPLDLDLTPFAGRNVTVELTVDPGPDRVPQFDVKQ